MERIFRFFTDTATLAAFDPQQLEHRADDAVDWWCGDFIEVDEVRSGIIALVSLGSDGVYQARITDQELHVDERDYAAEVLSNLGVTIVSGKLFVGPGECLPGGDSYFGSNAKRGVVCDLNNGAYRVDVYAIDWHDSSRWWTEGQETPPDAPSDYILLLRPRTEPMARLTAERRFNGVSEKFLFESRRRQVGPQPGMFLTSKVRKGPDGLSLKDCGPKFYTATLVDYSKVEWKDTIRFKVLTVDHEQKAMTGEFIEKVADT